MRVFERTGDCSPAPVAHNARQRNRRGPRARSTQPLSRRLLREREILRPPEQHDDVAGLEDPVGRRALRARALAPHAGHLDQSFEPHIDERLADAQRALGQQHRLQPRLQVVGRIGGVGRAVKESAEQAVALLADRADPRQHAVQRHAQQQQRVRREHQAALEHLGHDFRRAGVEQAVELAVVERAHDHRQLGPQLRATGAGS